MVVSWDLARRAMLPLLCVVLTLAAVYVYEVYISPRPTVVVPAQRAPYDTSQLVAPRPTFDTSSLSRSVDPNTNRFGGSDRGANDLANQLGGCKSDPDSRFC